MSDISGFDIDLAGDEDDLPPGVVPGTLSGTDAPEEEVTGDGSGEALPPISPDDPEPDGQPFDLTSDAPLYPEDVAGMSQGGDTGETPAPEPETPVETSPSPENEPDEAGGQEADSASAPAPPTPADKKARKKPAAKKKPAATATVKSGTMDRLYLIFRKVQAEVDGQIVEVWLRCSFAAEDGTVMDGIKSRNRDLALVKATKLFGHGFESTLVAVPEGMWEERLAAFKPREEYRVTVG